MLSTWISIAAKALAAHKFRSLLTIVSITIGAFAIVLMSSLAQSGLATLRQGVEEVGGGRMLLVAPDKPDRAADRAATRVRRGFTRAEVERLLEGVPHIARHTLYATLGMKDVAADNGRQDRTDIVAADSRFIEVYNMPVARGRAFTAEEDRDHARLCLAGPKLAGRLWDGDPLGKVVTVGALRCRVIGVLADNDRFGIGMGFDWVDLLVAPLEAVAELDPRAREEATILIHTEAPTANEIVKRTLNARLLHSHQGIDDFTFLDLSGQMAKFDGMFLIMQLIVGLIASVALVIGGVGVMNIMLVSVSERVREIGIRRALGATPGDISAQFLSEAVLLSAIGGLTGVLGGISVAVLASHLIHGALPGWIGEVSIPAVLAALTVSAGVGVAFGWVPARRAARLDPITAMRR